MKRPLILWGGRGQAKVLREFVEDLGYQVVCTFDNDRDAPPPFADIPLLYGPEKLRHWLTGKKDVACLAAVGGPRGRDRCELLGLMEAAGATPVVVVHPRACVARTAVLGAGCQVLAQSVVSSDAYLGRGCIINHAANVDHESILGDGVHVAPGATLNGCVKVGNYSFIGAGAVILPRLKVGHDAIVGAGAIVTRDVPDNAVVYGNPARIKRTLVV